jgi:signal transduction histidine kinase
MRQRSTGRGAFTELLEAGDRERAALANKLHASALQTLAAAMMSLSGVDVGGDYARRRTVLKDCARLIGDSIIDVRAVSYCASAPFVKELGLKAALEAYAKAFVRVYQRPFILHAVPQHWAGLKDALAAAFVNAIRDGSRLFAEARALAVRVTLEAGEGVLAATLEAEFEAQDAGPFDLAHSVATERLRPFGGFATLEQDGGIAILILRSGARRRK